MRFAKVMSYQEFSEAQSSSLNLNSEGSVHPVQGSLQWNSPSQTASKTCQKYRWVWTRAGKLAVAITRWASRSKEGRKDIKNSLLFTLPYLLFILLQNFTQTIANLHAGVEHRGTKQQKIKSISHPKGINNIKDKLFPLKQIHSYEIIFYYYKK